MKRAIAWLPVVGLGAWATAARAHHAMDNALPVTAIQGLLSGLGHPVIGIDHFLFIAAAGAFAARIERGHLLPLIFVFASLFTTLVRYLGADASLGELPVAGTLLLLGMMMAAATPPRQGVVALMFLAAGTIHGHALGEAIVGAERTPLYAYLAGLAVIQCAIALASWKAAAWIAGRSPAFPLQKIAGATVGVAGLAFAGLAII